MSVDTSRLQAGDVVLVRGVVGRPDRPSSDKRNIGVVFDHGGSGTVTHYVQASAIASVKERPLCPGDLVCMPNRENGTVLFVGAERAFVRWDEPGYGPEETATLLTHLDRTALSRATGEKG